MLASSDVVHELLDDRSYHIEFNGHLTNHAKHAVVALAGLGVPPEKIKAYYENYAALTSYGYGLEAPRPSQDLISEDNWEHYLGRRVNFSAYCEFFDRKISELGVEGVLRRYMPRLLPGWIGAFTHAAIHLGWALDIGSRWMAVEGLAYLAFSYVPCHPERAQPPEGAGDERPVASLLRIAGGWESDRAGLQHWAQSLAEDTASGLAAGMHPELVRSGLQYRIARTLQVGHPWMYRTPPWLAAVDTATVWDELYYAVTLLYLSRPGDFVLLHLITSLHGMEQIALRLPSDQQAELVRCFWIGILGVTFSDGNFPSPAKLAALHAVYQDAVDDRQAFESDWKQIVARAVEEKEEHNPKLVYVLRRVWRRTGGATIFRAAAGQFTATPELPPSFAEPPTE